MDCAGVFTMFPLFLLQIFLSLNANSVDLDQTPHYAASDRSLDCLPCPFLGH